MEEATSVNKVLASQAGGPKIYSQNLCKNVWPGGKLWGRWRQKDAWASLTSLIVSSANGVGTS